MSACEKKGIKHCIRISQEEKRAWRERMQELDFRLSMTENIRECLEIGLGLEIRDSVIYEGIKKAKPPKIEIRKVPKEADDIIHLTSSKTESLAWRQQRYKLGYSSIEKLVIDTVREILSISCS